MKKWIFEIGIFFLLTACTLNATQEQALNKQMALFLNAINDHSTLSIVSKTHPDYVKYAKEQGKDFFKDAFSNQLPEDSRLGNPIIQQTTRKGNQIHVLFQVETSDYFGNTGLKKQFVAISENDGISWFFVPFKVYQDRKICKGLARLV